MNRRSFLNASLGVLCTQVQAQSHPSWKVSAVSADRIAHRCRYIDRTWGNGLCGDRSGVISLVPTRLRRAQRMGSAGCATRVPRIPPIAIVWGTADTIFTLEGLKHLSQAFGNLRHIERVPGYRLFWRRSGPEVTRDQALRLWGVGIDQTARCEHRVSLAVFGSFPSDHA
jgi:hypothetical protein